MPIRILTSTLSTDDIRQAVAGDASTLDRVLRFVLHDVYGLALRFLWHPSDAEDATQEIAIRVLTGLSGFDGRSAFRTWVYRIAYNTLSALARKRAEDTGLSFDGMSEDLQEGLIDAARRPPRLPFDAALIEEVKTGCTLAMLTCLDRDHRLAYIIGTIRDIDHVEAASALEITPSAFRKRLSRANARIVAFVAGHCGVADSANECRCERLVPRAIARGRVDPAKLGFARKGITPQELDETGRWVRQLDAARRAAEIFRSHPDFEFAAENLGWVVELFSSTTAATAPAHRPRA